jgi:site-specific recombinase XerD
MTRPLSAPEYAPNADVECKTDEELVRGFSLALGAGGRKQRTLQIYEESIRMQSDFTDSLGLPGLAIMDRTHIRHWLTTLHQKDSKPSTVSVRYRSLSRFFNWCVEEGEREDNPMDRVDAPMIPSTIQPYYLPHDVESVVKAINLVTPHDNRDAAIIMILFYTGVRAAELCGMKLVNLNWEEGTILVTCKADKQRRVSFGNQSVQAIDRYLKISKNESDWLWIGSANKPIVISGRRMMLRRRFGAAGVKFQGAHAFRRGFAMEYLAAGGQEGDLKELGGWNDYAMVTRYAKANAGERAVLAHKKLSPGNRLDIG